MSAELGVISLIGKFLWAPFLLVFGFFCKKFFADIEKKSDVLAAAQHEMEKSLLALEKELTKNYYDKQELKEHIVNPLFERFSEVDTQVKLMSGMMNDIHSDMAILKYKILGEELKNQ